MNRSVLSRGGQRCRSQPQVRRRERVRYKSQLARILSEEISIDVDTVLVAIEFEVATQADDVTGDYLILDSNVRGSSGLFTNSAGPYHIPVQAGDKLVFSADNWEEAPGFRICGYTPNNDDALPVWPPGKDTCDALSTRRKCRKEDACEWNKKGGTCQPKPTCASNTNERRCNRRKNGGKCIWNEKEMACQDKLYGDQLIK